MKNKQKTHHNLLVALVAEFHTEKNGGSTFLSQSLNSSKPVWWKCNNSHEWEASVSERLQGKGNCQSCNKSLTINDPGYIYKDFLNS